MEASKKAGFVAFEARFRKPLVYLSLAVRQQPIFSTPHSRCRRLQRPAVWEYTGGMASPDLRFNLGDRLRLKENWGSTNAGAVARVIKEHWQPDGNSYYIIEWDNPAASQTGVNTMTVYQQDEARFQLMDDAS